MNARILFLFLLLASAISGVAQTFATDTLILHGSRTALYPLVRSASKPKAAEAINKCLQMCDFGRIRTAKNPMLNPDDDHDYRSWNISQPNDRLVAITTTRYVHSGTTGYEKTTRYLFDAVTGDRIWLNTIFTKDGAWTAGKRVSEQFVAAMRPHNDQMKLNYHQLAGTDFDSKAEYNAGYGWSESTTSVHEIVNFSVNTTASTIEYELPEYIPSIAAFADYGAPQLYHASLSFTELATMVSPYGNYLILGGSRPPSSPVSHTWHGTIGTNIPVTLVISLQGFGIKGFEVYDNFGAVITISGSYAMSKPGVIRLLEMGADYNAVAYFDLVNENGMLKGSWIKDDRTKTLPFEATVVGE